MNTILAILIGFYAGMACHEEGNLSDGARDKMQRVIVEQGLDKFPNIHKMARTVVAKKGSPPAEVCKNLEAAYGERT